MRLCSPPCLPLTFTSLLGTQKGSKFQIRITLVPSALYLLSPQEPHPPVSTQPSSRSRTPRPGVQDMAGAPHPGCSARWGDVGRTRGTGTHRCHRAPRAEQGANARGRPRGSGGGGGARGEGPLDKVVPVSAVARVTRAAKPSLTPVSGRRKQRRLCAHSFRRLSPHGRWGAGKRPATRKPPQVPPQVSEISRKNFHPDVSLAQLRPGYSG